MKAFIEIQTSKETKKLTKEHENEDDLIIWMVNISNKVTTSCVGYLEDRTYAIYKG